MNLKKIINKLFINFDLSLVKKSTYEKSYKQSIKLNTYRLADLINPKLLEKYYENINLSKSQLAQDLFVLSELAFKKNGFFVEFGAANGIYISNTYLLEKNFSWNGILAEPAKKWHKDLIINRAAHIETDCVWKTSNNTLSFNEVRLEGGLSTLDSFSDSDGHSKTRKDGIKYDINTISLNDLLKKYNAPFMMDYLSIDTEGSEYDILSSFNFDKYKFRVITSEHNFTQNREKIYTLLKKQGYERKFEDISEFDDWYVLTN